jgi:hypothetical protein
LSAYLGAVFLVAGFIVMLKLLGLVERSRRVVATSKAAMAALSDKELDDDQKEAAMQTHAKSLGLDFVLLTARLAIALLAPAGVILLLDRAGVLSFDAVISAVFSLELILGGTLLTVIVFWVDGRRRHGV